jgi:hypothetical protein
MYLHLGDRRSERLTRVHTSRGTSFKGWGLSRPPFFAERVGVGCVVVLSSGCVEGVRFVCFAMERLVVFFLQIPGRMLRESFEVVNVVR